MPENQSPTPALPEDIFDEPAAAASLSPVFASVNSSRPASPPVFSETPAAPSQVSPSATPPSAIFDEIMPAAGAGSRLWLWVVVGVIVVLGVAAAVYYIWFLPTNPSLDVGSGAVGIPSLNQPVVPVDAPDAANQAAPVVNADTDGDGLPDSEEQRLGTDPAKTDTDEDGLTDHEEITFYGTDPLNADTDGDGFLDGAEVRNGYDPKGPGKLFTIPSETAPVEPGPEL